jgi:short-subunit dehydrogenase
MTAEFAAADAAAMITNGTRFTSSLITGASSGIGAALAKRLAAPGVSLNLLGRRADALAAVADICARQGANAKIYPVDVRASDAVASIIDACESASPLDLVIANAGISAGTGSGGETAAQTREIFAINVDGVLNTVLPALPYMRTRCKGQVAIMSSLAGFRGLPGAPAYAASKAAVKSWGEGLRGALAAEGIGVSVICPGFVESGMTARNRFPMPFFMSADRAASIICKGLERNTGRIAFPWPMVFGAWFLDTIPNVVGDLITARLPKKS